MADELAAPSGRWQEEDSDFFLRYGDYFVPDREAQIEAFCRLLAAAPAPAHVVEIGCGEGKLAGALLAALPAAVVHGYDGSEAMRRRAESSLAAFGRRFATHPFELTERAWRRFPWPVGAVVSSLVLHHLDAPAKRELFADVARALTPGGAFLIADLILPGSAAGVRLAAAAWDDAVRERSLAHAGNLEPFERFQATSWNYFSDPRLDPTDKPSPLPDQLRWLEDAGLEGVDVFWMRAGHALYGGFKPA